jgi:hypothetical protein
MKEPIVKKGWSGIIIISLLLGFFVFLVSAGFLNYYYNSLGWFLGAVVGIIVFSVSVAGLRPKEKAVSTNVQNRLAIIGIVKEREKIIDGKVYGREIVRLDVYPRYVDLDDDILLQKGSNKNIAIIGMAGSGKTELNYYIIAQITKYHKIIFQYKNTDKYRELGYPVMFLKNYSPNVFSNKEAFTQAWVTAFSVENRGITASQVIPLIRNVVDVCKNWKEFKDEIERELKENEGTITGNALSDIRLKLDSVYSEKQYDIDIPQDIVVDFEGLNKDAFVFFAEFLMREIYEEVNSEKRVNTMIMVDEAHVFVKSGNTIIPELSAIIRSRGAFLFATQRTSTIAGDIKGNAGSQFCFLQTEKEDLDEVKALSEPYHWIVQRLHPYEFVDLAQKDSHEGIYIYRLINPKPNFKPIVEWKPDKKDKVDEEKGEEKEIDYPQEIIRLLNRPANQQDLAKRFVKEYGKDVNYWKMTLKNYLKKMSLHGEIGAVQTDYVKWIGDKEYIIRDALVYHRIGDYSYHDWLVSITADILFHKGFIPLVQAHGLPLADILVETPNRLAFEIETGSKNGGKLSETQQRIEEFEKQGYKVYVVVPNAEVKEKYKEFKAVKTAIELWEMKI